MRNSGRERMKGKLKEMSQEQDIERRLNQDFVATAPCHMPIVREWLIINDLSTHMHMRMSHYSNKCPIKEKLSSVSGIELEPVAAMRLSNLLLFCYLKER